MKEYKYLPIDLPTKRALQQGFSLERLQRYMDEVNGHEDIALALHAWNAHIGAALFLPLQTVELCLRNALHRQLSQGFGEAWFFNPDINLTHYASGKIAKAKSDIERRDVEVTSSRMVAELSFGFWVALLGRGHRYHDRLWIPHLHKAFQDEQAQALSREQVYDDFNHLRMLRNRISHHEPIFHRHLEADYATILRVCAWMHEDVAAWVDSFDDFALVLAQRPSVQAKKTWLQRVIPWL